MNTEKLEVLIRTNSDDEIKIAIKAYRGNFLVDLMNTEIKEIK